MASNRNRNVAIFNENIQLFTMQNTILANELHYAITNSEYLDKDFNINLTEYNNIDFKVSENTWNIDTINAILKLRETFNTGEIIALNFASAFKPGGGYVTGATAQEECICRSSGLYHVLTSPNCIKLYHDNKDNPTAMYSDRMIYSKDVPIIRDGEYNLLKNSVKCSFITSAAVNIHNAKGKVSSIQIEEAMDRRIEKIVKLAISKNPKAIVFGAYGCGVFGNKRENVFKLFEKHINRYVENLNNIKIVFAII